MKRIDALIDRLTMYRLVLYYLIGLLLAAVGLAIAGDLQYNPIDIIITASIFVAGCWGINKVLAYYFKAPNNSESSLITALILALLVTPGLDRMNVLFMLAASGLAMASKYVLAIRRKHVFNPAAIAVVLTALGPHQTASWWIGTPVMTPLVIIGGVLVARKIRREQMVLVFFAVTAFTTALFAFMSNANVLTDLRHMAFSSAIWFLGFVMLTEPLTSPPTEGKQAWYAALVGVLLPPQVHFFNLYSSPELALIVGNAFSYIVSPKTKLFLTLKEKATIATNTLEFAFNPGMRFAYQPGQYMEFTLPHQGTDARGSRRYFTLASSPTEEDLKIGVKFYDQGSSYKRALLSLGGAQTVVAAQPAGDFTLPHDQSQKVAFIAGGIGVTPFRSMAKYLIDTNDQRSVVMLYSARTEDDIAYASVFEEARQKIHFRTVYTLSDEVPKAPHADVYGKMRITAELIQKEIPDYVERIFYISGTHPMVVDMQTVLRSLGVPASHIKIDFFPGYA